MPTSFGPRPWWRALPGVALLCAASCGEVEGVPEGKLAVVGDVTLGPEDLAQVQHQLGTYAQRRFRGPEGQRNLLESLIDAELLAQEAIRNGLGDDPRVHWALLEEVGGLHLSAELERRVPRDAVAADVATLRAHFDAHPDDFSVPEKRVIKAVRFPDYVAAGEALARLRAGEVTLDELGDVLSTHPMARDDVEHPAFHAFLFADGLRPGDPLAEPVLIGGLAYVGVLAEIQPRHPEDFDDPAVRDRLIEAVRAPRLARAKAELLADLAGRFPERPVTR